MLAAHYTGGEANKLYAAGQMHHFEIFAFIQYQDLETYMYMHFPMLSYTCMLHNGNLLPVTFKRLVKAQFLNTTAGVISTVLLYVWFS